MAKKNYYAVREGIESGVIVEEWYDCERLVKGHKGAKFKGFVTMREAKSYLQGYKPVQKQNQEKKNKQGYIDTRDYEASEYLGTFLPATDKKDKYGAYKPAYYMKQGVRHANYGRTIGENYVPYTGDESVVPW